MRSIWLVLVCSCGGGDIGDTCRTQDECAEELFCSGPNDGPACGIAPREECTDDAACAGDTCHAIFDGCSQDGIGSECRPPCTVDGDCGGAEFRCETGACVAIPCDDGFTCPDRQICDVARITATTPVYDRHHGCFDVACATDGECGARVCVNGICQDAAGSCEEPMLVP